jgi:hypothetical protein
MEADGRRPEPRPMPAPIKWMLIALLALAVLFAIRALAYFIKGGIRELLDYWF